MSEINEQPQTSEVKADAQSYNHPTLTIILAAGKSTRFKRDKLLTPIAGKPVIEWCIDSLSQNNSDDQNESNTSVNTGINRKIIVLSPNHPYTHKDYEIATQNQPNGTAGALIAALEHAISTDSNLGKVKVVVACGDMPCLKPETVNKFYNNNESGMTIGVVKFEHSNHQYGIIKFDDNNKPCDILEYKERLAISYAEEGDKSEQLDTSEQKESYKNSDILKYNDLEYKEYSALESTLQRYKSEQKEQFVNSGLYVFNINIKELLDYLNQIPTEQHGEKYLTKLISIFYDKKQSIHLTQISENEMHGVNTDNEYRTAQLIIQHRLQQQAISAGAFLHDLHNIKLQHDTILEAGCEIHPYVCFGPKTYIKSGAVILPFTVVSGSIIGGTVGPFAHIRDGTITESNTHLGAFVETKDSYFDEGSKSKHHSYIGNCKVGKNTNIGAGVITCNYNGSEKNSTIIGENVDVGANTALIAPVELGNNTQTGANSVISKNIPDNMLSVTRVQQRNLRRIFIRQKDSRQKSTCES